MKIVNSFLLVLLLFASVNAQKWTTYDYNSSNYTLQSTNRVAADASGNIWIASYNAVVKFDQKSAWTVFNSSNSSYPVDNAVDLFVDAANTLWICTYGSGFLSFDGISKWNKYDPAANSGMPSNYTYCITFDNSGNAYVGIYSGNSQNAGMVKWNKSGTWTPAKFFDGYNYKNVEAIATDKKGNIWCGTSIGAYKYEPATGSLTAYSKENTNGGLCGNYVRAISVDGSGNVWFGCMDKDVNSNSIEGGLSKFDGTNWTAYKPSNSNLSNGNVSAIAFRSNEIWVGTGFCGQYAGKGLYKFDGTGWTNYASNTATYPGNCVNDIVVDKNNNVWVAGANVLTKIDFSGTDVQNENIPASFNLSQNYPNPFNPETTINYSIPVETRHASSLQHVILKVYDMLGREVATLVNEYKQPGNYNCELRIENGELTSGVYFYTLRAGGYTASKKMILLK